MTEILLFTDYREQLGQSSISWSETPITVASLKRKLRDEYKLANLDQIMIAVNEEFADNEAIIEDGDTVALIQPVSGG